MALSMAHAVPLAPLTTLQLGGAAEHLAEIADPADLAAALAWAQARGCPVTVLGGGSNVLVADRGVAGLVIRMVSRGIVEVAGAGTLSIRAAAGECWDDVVALAVARGAAGIECLSGIPGSVGATPIQNVGAYGQEVAQVVTRVRVHDRTCGEIVWMSREDCEFGYRTSVFKREPQRYVVLEVEYALRLGGRVAIGYAELARAVGPDPSIASVRDTVLGLRASKSMLVDPADENHRSVGSFFTNPIVSAVQADAVREQARSGGLDTEVPSWPQPDGRVKLAAAWLIEHSGTRKGERHGAVGVSTRHSLALVHHGGGTTSALLELADMIAARVSTRFGIRLALEPVLIGGDRR